MTVSVQYAESHFADLVAAADKGEPIEISRPDKPALNLVLCAPVAVARGKKIGRRVLGAGRGEMRVPSEEEWAAMDQELERQIIDAPLLTSGEI